MLYTCISSTPGLKKIIRSSLVTSNALIDHLPSKNVQHSIKLLPVWMSIRELYIAFLAIHREPYRISPMISTIMNDLKEFNKNNHSTTDPKIASDQGRPFISLRSMHNYSAIASEMLQNMI